MTERWEASAPRANSTRDATASSSDSPQANAGPTGTRAATTTQAGRSIGALLALRPAGPAPPDTTPPETTITSAPTGTIPDTSATTAFTANEPATFHCNLDNAGYQPCTSPITYTGLSEATHTFAVYATDTAENTDPTPATTTWTSDTTAAFPILAGAGDIASCLNNNDDATAGLLGGVVADGGNVTVFTTGDNVYPDGTQAEFADCYDPRWGRYKSRTRPSAGNHEYNTAAAAGYYGYFAAAAGEAGSGYYDYSVGQWQVIVLNSNCAAVGGCGGASPQVQWLRSVLGRLERRVHGGLLAPPSLQFRR